MYGILNKCACGEEFAQDHAGQTECWDCIDKRVKDNPVKPDINNEEIARINQELAKKFPVHNSVDITLNERGQRYGSFDGHAMVTQRIKLAYETGKNWDTLSPSQKEALEMIAHKIGRILNGDPNYTDSWHDIAGYAQLVEKELLAAGFK